MTKYFINPKHIIQDDALDTEEKSQLSHSDEKESYYGDNTLEIEKKVLVMYMELIFVKLDYLI